MIILAIFDRQMKIYLYTLYPILAKWDMAILSIHLLMFYPCVLTLLISHVSVWIISTCLRTSVKSTVSHRFVFCLWVVKYLPCCDLSVYSYEAGLCVLIHRLPCKRNTCCYGDKITVLLHFIQDVVYVCVRACVRASWTPTTTL